MVSRDVSGQQLNPTGILKLKILVKVELQLRS